MAKDKKANPLLDDEETVETKPKGKAKATTPAKGKVKATETEDTESELDEETDTDETDLDTDEDEEQDEKPAPKSKKSVEAPVEKVNVRDEMLTDIEITKRNLDKQPKVRIFIPLGIGEVRGAASAIETVSINGYRQVFKKGEYHTVAQAVAEQIEQHYNTTPENTEAGMRTNLANARMQDGMSTDEALS